MKINKNSIVQLHFSLVLIDGTIIESTWDRGESSCLEMGTGQLTENFENCLIGLQKGDIREFTLSEDQAFGHIQNDKVISFDISVFGDIENIKEGMVHTFKGIDGSETIGVIEEIIQSSVIVNFNHPLAGKTVKFNVEIINIEKE
ncbi:peptidylprolyl isomerase [Paraphotobacterium marinum]|uniref:Peptidyl-prolyl cis-trans isomerase n=1 Tax=Paraphotobacterium marinum TaxID=1755811 RepID=A0A220VD85_9GAMM|nr:FKBP-type peptidyl-prolyl cis-trans isomerase [Paraphotobacterium marinum]ASK78364.1 peptidylprolyl isomerase [Paraphotobacterium marinum]